MIWGHTLSYQLFTRIVCIVAEKLATLNRVFHFTYSTYHDSSTGLEVQLCQPQNHPSFSNPSGHHKISDSMRRIDVHHHFFPGNLNKTKSNRDVGWCTPAENLPWSPDISLKSMNASGTDIAILSIPALSTGSVGEENRMIARDRNASMAQICNAHSERFGFFASLPFLDDTEGNTGCLGGWIVVLIF